MYFWKRWTRDCLPTLELRQKCLFPKLNFKVDDVILVATELGAKEDWSLGRISATYPGADRLVRKVDFTTTRGELHRNVSKLCLLREVYRIKWSHLNLSYLVYFNFNALDISFLLFDSDSSCATRYFCLL